MLTSTTPGNGNPIRLWLLIMSYKDLPNGSNTKHLRDQFKEDRASAVILSHFNGQNHMLWVVHVRFVLEVLCEFHTQRRLPSFICLRLNFLKNFCLSPKRIKSVTQPQRGQSLTNNTDDDTKAHAPQSQRSWNNVEQREPPLRPRALECVWRWQ